MAPWLKIIALDAQYRSLLLKVEELMRAISDCNFLCKQAPDICWQQGIGETEKLGFSSSL